MLLTICSVGALDCFAVFQRQRLNCLIICFCWIQPSASQPEMLCVVRGWRI